MAKLLSFSLLLVLLLCVISTFAQGPSKGKKGKGKGKFHYDISVGCDNEDPSFEDAIWAANYGDTILVCGNVDLDGSVYIHKKINLIGLGGHKRGENNEPLSVLANGRLKFKWGSHGSKIRGFTLVDVNIIGKTNDITVENNVFKCSYEPITVFGRSGWVITGNTFEHGVWAGYAIGFHGHIYGAIIEGNTISGSYPRGVTFEWWWWGAQNRQIGGPSLKNIAISNNNFFVHHALSFFIGGFVENLAVSGNTFHGYEGIVLGEIFGTGITISENQFYTGAGIELENAFLTDSVISGNEFHHWHFSAISFRHVDLVLSEISENIIHHSHYGFSFFSESFFFPYPNDVFFAANSIHKNVINATHRALYFGKHVGVFDSKVNENSLKSHEYSFDFEGFRFILNEVSDNKYDSEFFYKLGFARSVDSSFTNNEYAGDQQENDLPPPPPLLSAFTEESFFAMVANGREDTTAIDAMSGYAEYDEGESEDPENESPATPDIEALIQDKLNEALSGVPKSEIDGLTNNAAAELVTDMEEGFRKAHTGGETAAKTKKFNTTFITVGAIVIGLMATILGVVIFRRGRRVSYEPVL